MKLLLLDGDGIGSEIVRHVLDAADPGIRAWLNVRVRGDRA